MNTGAPREPVAAACRCVAWMLSTALVFLFVVVCSLPTGCGAFGTSPRLDTKLRRLHRAPKRRRPAAVQAHSNGCNAEGEKEEKELRLLTWIEVEARIKREVAEGGTAAVIVPVGATEQHGPNGLIGTDHMTAEAVARGVSDVTSAVLAPTVNYGMSHHHASFPGTVTLRPATFVAVVHDVASSLSKMGFTHVLFVNGHGGNVGPAFKAFADFAAEQEQEDQLRRQEEDNKNSTSSTSSRARVKLISWYAGRESSALAKELYGGEVGQHATPDEVAVTQHLFPESIKAGVELDPAAIQVAKDLGGMTKRFKDEETGLSVMDVQDFRRRFPDGRMFSNPGLATPEHGRRLLEAAVGDATEALGKFLSGQDLVEEAEMKAKRAAAAAAAAAVEAAAAAEAEEEEAEEEDENNASRPRPRRDSNSGGGRGGGAGGGAEIVSPMQPGLSTSSL